MTEMSVGEKEELTNIETDKPKIIVIPIVCTKFHYPKSSSC